MQNDEHAGEGMLLAGFMIGQAAFGIDARLVQEVVRIGELTPVHGAPVGVIGIRNLRGRIVTVVDLAAHLNLGAVAMSHQARLLIMEHQDEFYGFLVDATTGTIAVDEDNIDVPPVSLNPILRSHLKGVWRQANYLTAILDAQSLFQWEQTAATTAE
jgi:purine-binding chemotaxis protein CheW